MQSLALFFHKAKLLHESFWFRIVAAETLVKNSRIFRASLRKYVFPEGFCHFLVENALFLE